MEREKNRALHCRTVLQRKDGSQLKYLTQRELLVKKSHTTISAATEKSFIFL